MENDSNLARKQNSNSWHGHRHQRLNLLLLALCWIGTPLIHSKIGRWCNFAVKKSFTNAFSQWAIIYLACFREKTNNLCNINAFKSASGIRNVVNDIEIPPPYLISTLSPSAACCLMPIFICPSHATGGDFFYPEAFIVCMRRFEDADNKRRLYLHHFIVFIVSTRSIPGCS